MDPKERPRLHARDHLTGGADPIDFAQFLGSGGAPDYETGVLTITNLVGYWRLGDGLSPFADISGFAPTDTAPMVRQARTVAMTEDYTPGAPITDDDGAAKFNGMPDLSGGTGDFLKATVASSDVTRFWFPTNAPFSITAWIKPDAAAVTHQGTILGNVHTTGFGGPGARDDGWRFDIQYPSRIVAFTRAVDVESGDPYDSAATPAGLAADVWHHLLGVYDGTDLLLYVNGTLVATTPSAGTMPGTTSANPPSIGEGPNALAVDTGFFKGAVDEAAVWAKGLTADEAAFLYSSGLVFPAGSEIVSDGVGGFTLAPPRIVYLNGA